MAAKLLIVLTLLGIFSAAVNAYTLTPFIGTISGSYILSTPTAVLIIDAQDSTAGGIALATAVKNIASPSVTPTIFVTHAHPDHFYGLAGFATIYPAVRIFVSSQEVRDSLINYIKSAVPPPPSDIASFDYADRIQVLPSESITILDVELEVRTGFVDTESSISSVVADPSNRRLFAGDTLAINSHMFLGPPITIQWIENWISAQNGLAARYDGYTVFAGHAPGVSSGDIQQVAQKGETYLRFFVQQLCAAPSISAIPQIMQKQYPTYFGSDFTSFITINPAWQTYRNSCPTSSSTASTVASQSLLFVVMMVVLGSIVIVF